MSTEKVHVMVDIETLDTKPTAVILSIGACTIRDAGHHTFYAEYNEATQEGRTDSQATIDWWDKQPGRRPGSTYHLSYGLIDLKNWLSGLRGEPIIWCKGTDFDTAILANAYALYGLEVPWKYNHIRDMRTLKKCHPHLVFSENLHPHHALQDALTQMRDLNQIFAYNQYLQWE